MKNERMVPNDQMSYTLVFEKVSIIMHMGLTMKP